MPGLKKFQEDPLGEIGHQALQMYKRVLRLSDEPPKFKRGDNVTVVRRMSWALPQPDVRNYRKDIAVGTSGTIEGWADLGQREVLLKVILDLPSGPR